MTTVSPAVEEVLVLEARHLAALPLPTVLTFHGALTGRYVVTAEPSRLRELRRRGEAVLSLRSWALMAFAVQTDRMHALDWAAWVTRPAWQIAACDVLGAAGLEDAWFEATRLARCPVQPTITIGHLCRRTRTHLVDVQLEGDESAAGAAGW